MLIDWIGPLDEWKSKLLNPNCAEEIICIDDFMQNTYQLKSNRSAI